VIDTINNTGSIVNGIFINSVSTLTTLNNLQGQGNINGALALTGKLPVNYNVIVQTPSAYGKLTVVTPTGQLNFGIFNTSILSNATYTAVLSGLSSGNILTSSLTGSYAGGYSYSLVQQGVTGIWDLVVSGGSSGGGSSGGSGGGGSSGGASSGGTASTSAGSTASTPANVIFGSVNSSAITQAQTLSGGTLLITNPAEIGLKSPTLISVPLTVASNARSGTTCQRQQQSQYQSQYQFQLHGHERDIK
jgi:hypothetical protein